MARRLEAAGAEVIAIPSVTSQAYHADIAAAVNVPVVDLLATVTARLHDVGVRRPALAVTDGTLRTGLLHRALTDRGLRPVRPDRQAQRRIQHCVDLVKSDRTPEARRLFADIVREPWAAQGDSVLIGCTDLSPLLAELPPGAHDVADLFAHAVLAQASLTA